MKTRTGFVSNSSSSSFIILATAEAFKEAVSRLENEQERKVIKYLAEDKPAFGQKMKMISEFSDAGGMSSIWGYDCGDQNEILRNAGIEVPEDEDEDGEAEEWYPPDSVFNYQTIIDQMAKEKEWKDQVFHTDVGDGG